MSAQAFAFLHPCKLKKRTTAIKLISHLIIPSLKIKFVFNIPTQGKGDSKESYLSETISSEYYSGKMR